MTTVQATRRQASLDDNRRFQQWLVDLLGIPYPPVRRHFQLGVNVRAEGIIQVLPFVACRGAWRLS
jgi:hypothetical protein